MTYVYNFDEPPPTSAEHARLLLGGKGHNLAIMRRDLGLPVPPGFTVTAEAGREDLNDIWPGGLDQEIEAQIPRMEAEVGRRFGGPGEPLLVSVRSGAAVSMPGMMDTILNLGLNHETVDALAEACGDHGFARESLRRFEGMYRRIVGVEEIPPDPFHQLRGAIDSVFRSWDSSRARSFREREGIPHHLGTAVTVQAMVFGNLDDNSATGVLFTRNPATGENRPYGDVLFRAQGEDVVAGTHETEPIERLGERLPEAAEELEGHSAALERHFRDVCDIEFTIERGRLWLLQVRVGKRSPQAALKFAIDMAEDDDFPLTRAEAVERVAHHLANPPVLVEKIGPESTALAHGLPASPGLASGRIATTADAAVTMAESGLDVVLVRPETSPDDVRGMARAEGILTTRGGLASHAAVVARGWGIPAVVGADAVDIRGDTVIIGAETFTEKDTITIDGQSGEIFAGAIEAETVTSPEAGTLLQWARDHDIAVPDRPENDPSSTEDRLATAENPADVILRTMQIKGFATDSGLAPVVLSTPETVAPILEAMQSDGLVKTMGEMFQLTEKGKHLAASLMSHDRESWTEQRANDALDGFLLLDSHMKETVTAWQMREVDGEQVINDHSDEVYDRRVLDRFLNLHGEAATWLQPLTDELHRLEMYLARLDRAADRVSGGDHDYIASPLVDSYHNVWFELHEDLIQLAGRTREEEAKAGRA